MLSLPPVTVLIPTYNYDEYISQAINSVFAQDYPSECIEIIVVDDGSTDDTKSVVASFGDKVKYLQQENQGKAVATLTGIQAATGKYVFSLDADDYYFPNRIRKAVEIFEKDPTIVHISHPALHRIQGTQEEWSEVIPKELSGKKLDGKRLLYTMMKKNITLGAGSTFSTPLSVIKNISIDPNIDMFIDEHLLLHTLPHGNSHFIEEPLSVWRVHGENFSGGKPARSGQRSKEERTFTSMRAVLNSLNSSEFNDAIRSIYEIKLLASELHMKERRREKTFKDIFSLLTLLIRNISVLQFDLIAVVYRHHISQRLLPTWSVECFRTAKAAIKR